MSIKEALEKRSGGVCELCASTENLDVFEVAPSNGTVEQSILACEKCRTQLNDTENLDENHWHCLNDSMWSEYDAVKVVAYRVLSMLKNQDMLDMLYLEEDVLTWAQATGEGKDDDAPKHRDSNGVELKHGDSVVIIKDLNVKGSSIVAKRGTAVRNITLVADDPELLEGKVNGQTIYILCKFVKK